LRILNKKTRVPAAWYQEDDVLAAARKRIRHLLDIFDHVVVAFSGGKDSMVCLELMHEFQGRVMTFFLDEELVSDPVLEVIDHYEALDWVDMKRIAVPLGSSKYILGRSYPYVMWDTSREWVRPMPPQSVTKLAFPPKDGKAYDQGEIPISIPDLFCLKGKVCVMTGIRATEGPRRFLSIATKLNECYISAVEGSTRVQQGKPVYDWTEEDIFKYLLDSGSHYCRIYDAQAAIGSNLRVSSPLHAEKMLHAPEQDEVDPDFWNRVCRIFPEVRVQERYGADLDRKAAAKAYGDSWTNIRRWIDEHIDDTDLYPKAVKVLERAQARASKSPDRFPLPYVLDHFINGLFAKRDILPKQVIKK